MRRPSPWKRILNILDHVWNIFDIFDPGIWIFISRRSIWTKYEFLEAHVWTFDDTFCIWTCNLVQPRSNLLQSRSNLLLSDLVQPRFNLVQPRCNLLQPRCNLPQPRFVLMDKIDTWRMVVSGDRWKGARFWRGFYLSFSINLKPCSFVERYELLWISAHPDSGILFAPPPFFLGLLVIFI